MGSEFDVAKKTVVHKVVSEIINPISASNLDLAATISEYLVDKTLAKLEKINSKLVSSCLLVSSLVYNICTTPQPLIAEKVVVSART